MSIKANKTMIGTFVLGALVLIVAGVVFFGGGKFLRATNSYIMYFEGSVKGLTEGSPVVIKGVKIGSVSNINLRYDLRTTEFLTEVTIDVIPGKMTYIGADAEFEALLDQLEISDDKEEEAREKLLDYFIEQGMRGQLGMQSMVTGQLMVQFDFFDPERHPAKFYGVDTKFQELPTVTSGLEKLSKTLDEVPLGEIVEDLQRAISGIEEIINSEDTRQSVRNLNMSLEEIKELARKLNDDFKPMSENVESLIDDIQQLVANVDAEVKPLSTGIQDALADARKLVNDVNERVDPLATSVDETLEDTRTLINNVNEQVEPLMTNVDMVVDAVQGALDEAQEVLVKVKGDLSEDSVLMYEITETLRSLSDAMNSLQSMADYLERHPEALIRGKRGS